MKTTSQLGVSSSNNQNNTVDNNNCNSLTSNGDIDNISNCSWMAFLQALWYGSMIKSFPTHQLPHKLSTHR